MSETLVKPKFKRLPLNDDGSLIQSSPKLVSPRNLVIVKYPKSGSTLACCNVKNFLILDADNGTDYFAANNAVKLFDKSVEGQFVRTKKYGAIPQTIMDVVDELNEVNHMKDYWKLYTEFENARFLKDKERLYDELVTAINKMKFPIVTIDTITSITNLSNEAALYEYNSGVKESSQKSDIKRVDEYGGVQYIRRKFAEIKKFIEENAAPFIQYHGHVAFKKKVLKKSEEDINALDIALDGILSTTFTAHADAVCTFNRDEKGCWLDFTKKEETDLGSRPNHLSNEKIKIADIMQKGEMFPKTYWKEVYPELSFV